VRDLFEGLSAFLSFPSDRFAEGSGHRVGDCP